MECISVARLTPFRERFKPLVSLNNIISCMTQISIMLRGKFGEDPSVFSSISISRRTKLKGYHAPCLKNKNPRDG